MTTMVQNLIEAYMARYDIDFEEAKKMMIEELEEADEAEFIK